MVWKSIFESVASLWESTRGAWLCQISCEKGGLVTFLKKVVHPKNLGSGLEVQGIGILALCKWQSCVFLRPLQLCFYFEKPIPRRWRARVEKGVISFFRSGPWRRSTYAPEFANSLELPPLDSPSRGDKLLFFSIRPAPPLENNRWWKVLPAIDPPHPNYHCLIQTQWNWPHFTQRRKGFPMTYHSLKKNFFLPPSIFWPNRSFESCVLGPSFVGLQNLPNDRTHRVLSIYMCFNHCLWT